MKRDIEDSNARSNGNGTIQQNSDGEDETMSNIDVDFEFFDLNPSVDFHALNTLFKQLFGPDAINFELGALADLFLANPIGSTVKVDGEESDPYAVLTVLNMSTHRAHAQVKILCDYILSKSKKDEKCYKSLHKMLSEDAKGQTGFLFSERLINMPVEVCPPLYRILSEEVSTKSAVKPEYKFDHYILWSKSYVETVSKLDDEDDRPKKKGKASKGKKEVFYFHPEDEILLKHALHHVCFQYTNEQAESDSKRAFYDFGIQPSGELIVLTKAGLAAATQEMQTAYPF